MKLQLNFHAELPSTFFENSDNIKNLQKFLKSFGYDIGGFDVDGKCGKDTKKALAEFKSIGYVKNKSISKDDFLSYVQSFDLRLSFKEIPTFGQYEKSDEIKKLQELLIDLGYDVGESGVDSTYGNDTKNAIEKLNSEGTIQNNNFHFDLLSEFLNSETSNVSTSGNVLEVGYAPLSWEKSHQERKPWSAFVFKTIEALFDSSFSLCEDMTRFRSDYNTLTRKQKVNVWGELISAICKVESAWNPASTMVEKTMGIDPVTKKDVRSEGLMQLSYQDKDSYPELPCRFDWNTDQNLDVKDPAKTIFNPEINLEFGISILAKQIRKRKHIVLDSGVYWAVIKEGGKYTKITEIAKMVENLKL